MKYLGNILVFVQSRLCACWGETEVCKFLTFYLTVNLGTFLSTLTYHAFMTSANSVSPVLTLIVSR